MTDASKDGQYDLAILGGGPGGYAAALRAGDLGLRVALIESGRLGGLCLNEGCIPSKALLHSADVLDLAREAGKFGIKANEIAVDWAQVQLRKQQVVERLRGGLETLVKDRGVTVVEGRGIPAGRGIIAVQHSDGSRTRVAAPHTILATGSEPVVPVGATIDGKVVVDTTGALVLSEIPSRLVILGGDWWAVEFASMYRSFGSEVVLVEAGAQLVPGADADVARALARSFEARGIRVMQQALFEGIVLDGDGGAVVRVRPAQGEPEELSADKVIVAAGRTPRTEDLGALSLGLSGPHVRVDRMMRASAEGIYAVGDIVPSPGLAHVAFAKGCSRSRPSQERAPPR